MKVLILTTHFNCGGVTSYILNLARGLIAGGNNVIVASSGGDSLDGLKKLGVKHFNIPVKTKCEVSWRVFLSAWKLLLFLRENKIEVMHSHSRVTQVLGTLVSRVLNLPHVTTCHGFFKVRFSRRVIPGWGGRVIAISEAVKEHLIKDFKVAPDMARLVYSGIPVKAKEKTDIAALRARFGLKSAPVIGIVARLSDVKGHKYLIQAMPDILAEFSSAQLFIIGEGKMRDELLALASGLGIKNNVVMITSVSDTSEVLAATDIFVMPSLQEGLGLAVMEAMAAGLPVVASDIGGIPALIKSGERGLLVEPGNPDALAEAVIFMLKNKERALEMGHAAADFIARNFSLEKMARETLEVYREVTRH